MDKIALLKDQDAAAALPAQEATQQEKDSIAARLKKIKSVQKNRSHYERQWLTNIAFLYGKQHFAISKKNQEGGLDERILWELKNLERSKKTQMTVNYILPLYRSILARTLMMKSKVFTEAETQTQRDVDSSKVGQELLEDLWQNVNKTNDQLAEKYCGMAQTLAKVLGYMLAICQGHIRVYYNPKAKGKAVVNGEVIESEIGAVEWEVLHNFEVIKDPMGQWVCIIQIKSTDWIKDNYGVETENENITISDFEKQLMSLLDGTTEETYENGAKVYQFYHRPCGKYPNGKIEVFTEAKMISDGELPPENKGKLGIFSIGFLDIPLAPYPQSMIEGLIPMQEDYNYTVQRIRDYKKWMTGKILAPDGAKLQSKWDDQVAQLIKWSGTSKPDYLAAPQMPQQLFEDLNRIRRDMEDHAATHDVSMSRTPSGVKSGVAIDALTEADNGQLAPQLQHIESQLSFAAEFSLQIMQEKYAEDRLASIAGDNMKPEIRTFTGEKAKGNYRVRVTLGSSMPTSRTARINYILQLKKEGIITPEKTAALLEIEDTEGLFNDIDRQGERSEIQDMLKGIQIEPSPWENHTVRLKVLADFMMGDDFKQLKMSQDQAQLEIASMIYNHYLMTQEMLLQEQQVMAGPQGGGQEPAQQGKQQPGQGKQPAGQ